jgi:anti-sigma regulatory factor (Ser/Thr protein kinase)
MLVVSELVTNSVRAGATSITLELTADDDVLALSVSDDAPGWPTARNPAWGEVGGRGLAIVEKVADEWTTRTLGTGKRVTACWHLVVAGPLR